ncbi:hypothetical protein SAMN04488579_10424 [Eubacterium barkeri]|uniref:Uncharacterized protein n=2 Tax=Eubacterium barkeri TaxID=1528 RepID=A0A1H3CY45_EUBBA|nr:hypothetical protein SAMN04488579_10424 [Eubacterium barkeri]
MKKQLVCAVVAGVAVGTIYLLCKSKKEKNISLKSMEEVIESELEIKEDPSAEKQDAIQEMYVAKENSAQSVGERHTVAAGIMADAFSNIMREIEPVEFDEKFEDTVVDTKDIDTINKLDLLSNELDELEK